MKTAAISAITGVCASGGVLTVALEGVTLHVDKCSEVLYLEVEPHHGRAALGMLGGLAEELGYEIMPEWECPAEHLPTGAVRHWMAEREVMDDGGSLQTV